MQSCQCGGKKEAFHSSLRLLLRFYSLSHWWDIKLTFVLIKLNYFQLPFTAGNNSQQFLFLPWKIIRCHFMFSASQNCENPDTEMQKKKRINKVVFPPRWFMHKYKLAAVFVCKTSYMRRLSLYDLKWRMDVASVLGNKTQWSNNRMQTHWYCAVGGLLWPLFYREREKREHSHFYCTSFFI